MITLAVALVLAQPFPQQPTPGELWQGQPAIRPRVFRDEGPRMSRLGAGDDYAFFELAPANGAGLGAACACAAITTAQGNAITWARASSAYCTKEGTAVSGLTTTSMALCTSALPRVERDGDGFLGLRYEQAKTNSLLRSEELSNVAWTATATVTADQAVAPWGATVLDQLSDASGAAQQGVSQVVASTAQVRNVVSCYVRAGTATSATITLTGTGNSAGDCTASLTGLSTDSINRISCASSTAYTAGITAKTVAITVGDAVGVTGTIMAGGCQLEDAFPLTSYIATTSAAVTRATDSEPTIAGLTLTSLASGGSAAVNITPFGTGQVSAAGMVVMGVGGTARLMYFNTTMRIFDGANEAAIVTGFTGGTAKRYWSSWASGTLTIRNATNANQATTTFGGTMETTTPLRIGSATFISTTSNWIISRICLDPVSSRCR